VNFSDSIEKELALGRLRTGWPCRGGGLQPHRDGQAQPRGALRLAARRAAAHQRPSGDPARATAADALEAGVNSPMRTPPMQDATLIEALSNATSLELYQCICPRSPVLARRQPIADR